MIEKKLHNPHFIKKGNINHELHLRRNSDRGQLLAKVKNTMGNIL